MAIQTINLAVPGGDTPRSANTKINANFSDQTHAASRIVGAATGQVPTSEQVFAAYNSVNTPIAGTVAGQDCNLLEVGKRWYVNTATALNAPPSEFGGQYYLLETRSLGSGIVGSADILFQLATDTFSGFQVTRARRSGNWTAWRGVGQNKQAYESTTAAGANVVADAAGKLMRSTSSERYKDILAPLELDDARYADAMALKPIVYRSTADADNPAYHYYSFSAEELGSYDPAFTLWRDTETVTDEDGNVTEQPLEERQAEGININALLAMGHAIAIKQGELIKDLQDQLIEQKEEIAALKQTNL